MQILRKQIAKLVKGDETDQKIAKILERYITIQYKAIKKETMAGSGPLDQT